MAKAKRKTKREPVNVGALSWYCRGVRTDLSKVACGIAVAEFSFIPANSTPEVLKLAATGMNTAAAALESLSKEVIDSKMAGLVKKAKSQATRASNLLGRGGEMDGARAQKLHTAIHNAKVAAERVSGLADERCYVEVSRIRCKR
jgi:hypothetical protein